MPVEIVTKGWIEVWRDGAKVSQHTVETKAIESALAHAEANGDGEYELRFPRKTVSVLTKTIYPFFWVSAPNASFTTGTASSVDLRTFYSNVQGKAVTITVASGSLPSGVTIAGTLLNYDGVGAAGSGTYTLRLTGAGFTIDSSSGTATITGTPANQPPYWTVAEGYALSPFTTAGGTASLADYAVDPEGDPMAFARTGGTAPGSVTVSADGVLTVPAGLAAGTYTVVVDLTQQTTAGDLPTFTLTAAATDTTAPFMVGVVFPSGAVPSGTTLVTSEPNSSVVIKRRWNDGSAKHAIVCGYASLTAGVPKVVTLQAGTRGGTALTATDIQTAAPTASVQLGAFGTVTLSSLLASPFRTWISTPDMVECHYRASVTADLAVWFHVRRWANGRMWVRAFAENGYVNGSAITRSYTATVTIGGSTVYSGSVSHYAYSRWTATGWIGTSAVVRNAQPVAELVSSRLVPNYWRRSPSASKLNSMVQTYAPMQLSPQPVSMGDAGFGDYIGVLPNWSALCVTSGDARAFDAALVASSAFNTYSICQRSGATNRIAKPSDFPSVGFGEFSSVNSAGTWEVAHLVNEGYVAYLATGDYWHLETLAFNASYCYLTINTSGGTGVNKILRGETRAVGWMLNAVGHYCAIAPVEGEVAADASVVSDYQTLFANNVAHWAARISTPGQNQLGSLYQYSMGAWAGTGSVAPWMTDFWVIVNGALSHMDPIASLTDLTAMRDWMYRWIVGRLGTTGAANYHFSRAGSEYGIIINTANNTDPTTYYDSWGDVWAATFGSANAETTNTLYRTSPGASNDPAYAATNHRWGVALAAIAYAVDDSATGASAAWSRFTGADNWSAIEGSNFNDTPVWGIVPGGYGGT